MGCGSSCKNMSVPGTATHAASIVHLGVLRLILFSHLHILSLPPPQ